MITPGALHRVLKSAASIGVGVVAGVGVEALIADSPPPPQAARTRASIEASSKVFLRNIGILIR